MTMPRYLQGCSDWSQVPGEALSGNPDYAWNVNANNGNVNNNHRNNNGFALAVRSAGEFQGEEEVTLESLYRSWRRARQQKVPSHNQLSFERDWIGNLIRLQADLNAGAWSPSPSTCFIARRPKAREIHAPDFADRVMHHWLVPRIEAIFEPGFIYDSYANRRGKGTHAAVERLRGFVRQVERGQGGGWYLQLDIHNFFNSIHRQTLWSMLKRKLERAGATPIICAATHALLRHSPLHAGVEHRATAEERAAVPLHKRLENAAPGCGLPIGNLSSQFFANVYLDALDQFVKHKLKAARYLRYVDDFVLVHHDRDQLDRWRAQIEQFLHDRLRLRLKPDIRLRPLRTGIDFLGYVIFPTHTRVRQRVVRHARGALAVFAAEHVRGGVLRASPAQCRRIRSVWGSYCGHFAHANSWRLQKQLAHQHPWLQTVQPATPRRTIGAPNEGFIQ